MTHEIVTVASEIYVLSATVCALLIEDTYGRQSVDVFTSSHHHEKDQPNCTRDTAPGVN